MKKAILMILALCLLAVSAGCGDNLPAENPVQTTAPAITPAPTTTPDYGHVDFSGHWAVSEVYDSVGSPVTGSAFEALETGFELELLKDGVYFVYDGAGVVLGQGSYAVSGDVLTLTAGGAQTVYTVADENTLRTTAQDGSVTVMTRLPEEAPKDSETPDDEEDLDDDDVPDGETDIPEDDSEAA